MTESPTMGEEIKTINSEKEMWMHAIKIDLLSLGSMNTWIPV